MTKKLLLLRLNRKGVAIYLNCEVQYVTAKAVAAKTMLGLKLFPATKVIVATGYVPGSELAKKCDFGERDTYIIGDANGKHPAGLLEAMWEGFSVGHQV